MSESEQLQIQNTAKSQKKNHADSQGNVQTQILQHATEKEPVEKEQHILLKKDHHDISVFPQNNVSHHSQRNANTLLQHAQNAAEQPHSQQKHNNNNSQVQLQQVSTIIIPAQENNNKQIEKVPQTLEKDIQQQNNKQLQQQKQYIHNEPQKGRETYSQQEEKLQIQHKQPIQNADSLIQKGQLQQPQSLRLIKLTQEPNHTSQIAWPANQYQKNIQKPVKAEENQIQIQNNQPSTSPIQQQVSNRLNNKQGQQQTVKSSNNIQQQNADITIEGPAQTYKINPKIQNQYFQQIKHQKEVKVAHGNINSSSDDHKEAQKQITAIQQQNVHRDSQKNPHSLNHRDLKQKEQQISKVHQESLSKKYQISIDQNYANINRVQPRQSQESQKSVHWITNYPIQSKEQQSQDSQYSQNKKKQNFVQQNKQVKSKTIELPPNDESQEKQKYRLHSQYFQSVHEQKHQDKQVILFTQFSQNEEPADTNAEQVTNLLQIKEETSSATNIIPLELTSIQQKQGQIGDQNVQVNLISQQLQKHTNIVPSSQQAKTQTVKEESPRKEGVGKIAKRTLYQKKVYQIVKDLTRHDENKNVIPILDQPRRLPKNKINLSKLDSHIELQSNVLNLTIGQIMSKDEDVEANNLLQQIDLLKQNLRQLQKKRQSRQYESPSRMEQNANNTISSAKRHKKQMTGRIYRKFENQSSRVSEQINNSSREQTNYIPIEPFTINSAPRKRFFSTNGFQGFKPKQQQKINEFGKKIAPVVTFRVKRPSKSQHERKDFDSQQKQAGFIKNKSKQEQDQCFQARPQQNYEHIQFTEEDKLDLIQQASPRQLDFTPKFREEIEKYFLVLNLQTPNRQMAQQELVQLAKVVFKKFGVNIQAEKAAVLSVKKYKNCVSFTLDSDRTILWYYEGKFYYGGWIINKDGEGQKNGWGYEQIIGKYVYNGFYKGNKKQGYGVIKFLSKQNDVIYEGFWVNGLKQGLGRQIQSDGIEYIGSWREGKKHGQGKLNISQKQSFVGNFIRGVKNGYGRQIFKNADTFEGEYADGKFSGKGIYTWANLSRYEGQFKNGSRNGHGTWVSNYNDPSSDRYQGQYKNDKKSGFGLYRWKDGTSYEGQFLNDLKHGQGVVSYGDGRTAKLQWLQGVVVPRQVNRQSSSKKGNNRANSHKSQNSKILLTNTPQLVIGSQSRSKPTRISLGVQRI